VRRRLTRDHPPRADDVIRHPLSLRQVEDLLFEREKDFGAAFAEGARRRIDA
jgi:hypothetical protein